MKQIYFILCMLSFLAIACVEKESLSLEGAASNQPYTVITENDTTAYLKGSILEFRAVNTYPYGEGTCPSSSDPWGFYKQQCTSFDAYIMNMLTGYNSDFYNTMTGSGGSASCTDNSGRLSNACRWDDRLSSYGYFVTTTPTPGAIAHWNANEAGAAAEGHVGVVLYVNTNGSAYIAEYNWKSCSYSERSVFAPRYIRWNTVSLESGMRITPNPIIRNGPVEVSANLKFNGKVRSLIQIRAAIYSNTNVYLGTLQSVSSYFDPGQTRVIVFKKSSITYPAGTYKIWIETKFATSSIWVLTHRLNSSSTQSISIK